MDNLSFFITSPGSKKDDAQNRKQIKKIEDIEAKGEITK